MNNEPNLIRIADCLQEVERLSREIQRKVDAIEPVAKALRVLDSSSAAETIELAQHGASDSAAAIREWTAMIRKELEKATPTIAGAPDHA